MITSNDFQSGALGIPLSVKDEKAYTLIVGLEFFINTLMGIIEEAHCITTN